MPDSPGSIIPAYTPSTPDAPGVVLPGYTPGTPASPGMVIPAIKLDGMRLGGTVPDALQGVLRRVADSNGRPAYQGGPADGVSLYWNSAWILEASGQGYWVSSSDVATPDLATGWFGGGGAEGTPVITVQTPAAPGSVLPGYTPGTPDSPGTVMPAVERDGMQLGGTVLDSLKGLLRRVADRNGRRAYQGGPADGVSLYWNTPWILEASGHGYWTSSSDVATPDLATGWAGGGGAEGTPVITVQAPAAPGSALPAYTPGTPDSPGSVLSGYTPQTPDAPGQTLPDA